jgi:hypothetical protein
MRSWPDLLARSRIHFTAKSFRYGNEDRILRPLLNARGEINEGDNFFTVYGEFYELSPATLWARGAKSDLSNYRDKTFYPRAPEN